MSDNNNISHLYPICLLIGIVFALTAYSLCIAWSTSDNKFSLGVPSWTTNGNY